jgi:hypothetical protein
VRWRAASRLQGIEAAGGVRLLCGLLGAASGAELNMIAAGALRNLAVKVRGRLGERGCGERGGGVRRGGLRRAGTPLFLSS